MKLLEALKNGANFFELVKILLSVSHFSVLIYEMNLPIGLVAQTPSFFTNHFSLQLKLPSFFEKFAYCTINLKSRRKKNFHVVQNVISHSFEFCELYLECELNNEECDAILNAPLSFFALVQVQFQ